MRKSLVERQSSKREIVDSNPAVGKNVSCCNSRSLRVDHSSNHTI